MVPQEGLEPPLPKGKQILSLSPSWFLVMFAVIVFDVNQCFTAHVLRFKIIFVVRPICDPA